LKGTKTSERRDFPCNAQLAKFLAELPKNSNPYNLVFPSPKGTYIDQHNFAGRFWLPIVRELATSNKIKQYLPCYNLRHSFITRLVREGLDVATIAKLVGNSPKMIFQHYLSANADLVLPEF
jgi:integrase